jgi:hypothetical protein
VLCEGGEEGKEINFESKAVLERITCSVPVAGACRRAWQLSVTFNANICVTVLNSAVISRKPTVHTSPRQLVAVTLLEKACVTHQSETEVNSRGVKDVSNDVSGKWKRFGPRNQTLLQKDTLHAFFLIAQAWLQSGSVAVAASPGSHVELQIRGSRQPFKEGSVSNSHVKLNDMCTVIHLLCQPSLRKPAALGVFER